MSFLLLHLLPHLSRCVNISTLIFLPRTLLCTTIKMKKYAAAGVAFKYNHLFLLLLRLLRLLLFGVINFLMKFQTVCHRAEAVPIYFERVPIETHSFMRSPELIVIIAF